MKSAWSRRRDRARHWLARDSPAEEMLLFYLELLELQEPIYRQALESDWGTAVETGSWFLHPERITASSLLPGFRKLLRAVAPATDVLTEVARTLESSSDAKLTALLESFLRRTPLEEIDLGHEAVQLEFFPRAFLEPVAEALREKTSPTEDGLRIEGSCPRCGWPPQVGVLRDEPEAKGRRLLVCSLCSAWWRVPRARCPGCGETDPARLGHYVSESVPHVRIDECRTCRAYLKTVDLRKDGMAVPVVEDLASVELDLWSREQGLRKLRRNLLGF